MPMHAGTQVWRVPCAAGPCITTVAITATAALCVRLCAAQVQRNLTDMDAA